MTTAPRAFAALTNRDLRRYFYFSVAAIMADNVEHVISYWVLYQKFHSPALGGFAVISHWVPHLLFAAYSGTLADRFDVRRLIQLGMLLLMGVSLSWDWMFYTDTVQMWKAMLLLIAHGMAGVIWLPASQVLIHQIVRPQDLPSAVRLNATGRYMGFLTGPAVGAALLLAFGPVHGIWINSLICVPMLIWLIRAPYGAAVLGWRPPPRALRGLFAGIVLESRSLLPSGTHGLLSGHDPVGVAGGVRARRFLLAGHRAVVPRGLRGTGLQCDGADSGAIECAD